MEKEQKFVDYMSNLKDGSNDKLINTIIEGFSAITKLPLMEAEEDSLEGSLHIDDSNDDSREIVPEKVEEESEEQEEVEEKEESVVDDEETEGSVAILKSMYLEIKKMYKQLTDKEFNAEEFDAADNAIMESQLNGSNLLKLMEMVATKANLLESITPEDANAMTPEEARIKLDELSKIIFRMLKMQSITQDEADAYLRSVTVPLIKRINGNPA